MDPRRALPALLLVVVAACGSVDPAAVGSTTTEPRTESAVTSATETIAGDPLPDLGPAPELLQLDGWLQTDIDSLEDLRGKVVVVQFWTFGCHNCKATLPNLKALYAEHQGEKFEVVGIHSPEFDYEKDPEAIAAAAGELGVTWPIALDTTKRTFFHWQKSPAYWPRTYVLDREGHIRFDHIGEGAYEELNETVATLLG
jgi:thiol-disulfide isomerase/thioredoxin